MIDIEWVFAGQLPPGEGEGAGTASGGKLYEAEVIRALQQLADVRLTRLPRPSSNEGASWRHTDHGAMSRSGKQAPFATAASRTRLPPSTSVWFITSRSELPPRRGSWPRDSGATCAISTSS
jgi:hypothetical protein